MDLFNRKALMENILLKKENKKLKKEIEELNWNREKMCMAIDNNYKEMYNEKVNKRYLELESKFLEKEITYKAEIKNYSEIRKEETDAFINLSDKYDKLKEKYCKIYRRKVITMPNQDGKGPRDGSYMKKKNGGGKKTGHKQGNC